MYTIWVSADGRQSNPVPDALTDRLLGAFGGLRAAAENVGLRQELSLARQRRRRVVDDAKRRATLALSAGRKPRPQADGELSEFLDQLSRGLAQLKRLVGRTQTALVRDAERRRATRYMDNLQARRARGG